MKTTFAGKVFASQASAENNPFQAKLTFVFTDFEPNSNKERVLPEEADNLLTSGQYAPIKILFGRAGPEGHPGSYPVGPITKLYLGEYKDNPAILGEAVLWKREFPFIDDFLAAASEGEVQFSWELGYTSDSIDPVTGVKTGVDCFSPDMIGGPAGTTIQCAVSGQAMTGISSGTAQCGNVGIPALANKSCSGATPYVTGFDSSGNLTCGP
jgi:hypothetical protein